MKAEMGLSEGEIEVLLIGLYEVRENIEGENEEEFRTKYNRKEHYLRKQRLNSLISRLEENLKKMKRLIDQPVAQEELPPCLRGIKLKIRKGYILFTTYCKDIRRMVRCLLSLEEVGKVKRVKTASDFVWEIPHCRQDGEVFVNGRILIRVEPTKYKGEIGEYRKLEILFDYYVDYGN